MKEREKWSSGIGFILAAAGSAVGLGNLWKFPYIVGKNGGGAFVLIYLAFLFTIGLSVILGEMVIGRATQKNVYGAYRSVSPKFAKVGTLGIITGFLIICFYSAVGGWTVRYMLAYLTTGVSGDPALYFSQFTASPWQSIGCQILFLLITAFIVYRGIAHGIEKASKLMMPMLFVILLVLVVRSLTLPNAMEGVRFFLKPDFSKVTSHTVVAALGQAFFSLSVGMGTLITYGSYIDKKENLQKTAFYVPLLDSIVAMLGGFAILPAVFSFGFAPTEGPSLTFITLPAVFESMPFGRVFGILFFILLFFAAVTSAISMYEVIIAYLVEEKKISRKKAVIGLTCVIALFAAPCALSQGILADFKLFGKTVFDLFDFTASNILMPVGGILMCIFIGYIWKPKNAVEEIRNQGKFSFPLKGIWTFVIKYAAPIAIVVVLLSATGIVK